MKRLFMILSAVFGMVVLTFGQEDSTKLRLTPSLLPKRVSNSGPVISVPVIVDHNEKLFDDSNRMFDTYPMPNAYSGDNCVPMPNAYRGDNSVSMPNVYRGPIVLRHSAGPADSTQQLLKKYEHKKEEGSQAEQPNPR